MRDEHYVASNRLVAPERLRLNYSWRRFVQLWCAQLRFASSKQAVGVRGAILQSLFEAGVFALLGRPNCFVQL